MNSLVFFGNDRLATGVTTNAPTLRALIGAGYQIKAVIINQAEINSRDRHDPEVVMVAKSHNIDLVVSKDLRGEATNIAALRAEAGILTAFGQLLPEVLLTTFPAGIINIHPSLLPKYRGPIPIEQAILDGSEKTGVSLMKLTERLDAGPIYAQTELKLKGSETKQELADKLNGLGAKLLVSNLPDVLSGKLSPTEQDQSGATYTERLKKSDGTIDWSKPAMQIEREVRAYAGWPKSRSKLEASDAIITRVRPAKSESDGDLVVKTGDGWLEVVKLIAPSGRKMSGADFMRGYKQ